MNIEFSNDHTRVSDEKNCQLLVAITGTKEGIIEQLTKLLNECNDTYGKPRQGIYSNYNATMDVITPTWHGKKF